MQPRGQFPADGGREEKRVNELENAAPAAGRTDGAAPPPPLPDLTGLGLRDLRASTDPVLAEAVRGVLLCPAEPGEGWDDGGVGGLDVACAGR